MILNQVAGDGAGPVQFYEGKGRILCAKSTYICRSHGGILHGHRRDPSRTDTAKIMICKVCGYADKGQISTHIQVAGAGEGSSGLGIASVTAKAAQGYRVTLHSNRQYFTLCDGGSATYRKISVGLKHSIAIGCEIPKGHGVDLHLCTAGKPIDRQITLTGIAIKLA